MHSNVVRRLLASARFRAALMYLPIGLLLIGTVILASYEIEHHIGAIEAWIANLGHWSVVAFIGFFVLTTSFLLPEAVLAIIAGALFGLLWGFAAVMAGNLIAATLQFILSQYLLRTYIQRAIAARPTLAAIQRTVNRDAYRLQVVLRLTPLNPATISYLLGAAGVRFSGFLLACLALTPHLFIEVYLGHAGKHIARMAGRHTRAVYLHDLTVIGGLVVTIIVIVFVSRTARKALMEAVSGTVTEPPTVAKK
jgi:uncharacterized membrane protein YdjX (TVP38/TMEM64 family)